MKMIDYNDMAQNELNILKSLGAHANIVRYFDHFETQIYMNSGIKFKKLCIITEFCEVYFDLFFILNKKKSQ